MLGLNLEWFAIVEYYLIYFYRPSAIEATLKNMGENIPQIICVHTLYILEENMSSIVIIVDGRAYTVMIKFMLFTFISNSVS